MNRILTDAEREALLKARKAVLKMGIEQGLPMTARIAANGPTLAEIAAEIEADKSSNERDTMIRMMRNDGEHDLEPGDIVYFTERTKGTTMGQTGRIRRKGHLDREIDEAATLARAISRDLFTDGEGHIVSRFVLAYQEYPGGPERQTSSGLAECVLADRIAWHLRRWIARRAWTRKGKSEIKNHQSSIIDHRS